MNSTSYVRNYFIMIILSVWFLVAFTCCGKIETRRPAAPGRANNCRQAYRMPDGAVCKWKDQRTAQIIFRDCTPEGNHVNPSVWFDTEVCQ